MSGKDAERSENADVTVQLLGAAGPDKRSSSASWLIPALISFVAAVGGGILTSWTTTRNAEAGKIADLKTAAYGDFANAQGTYQSTNDAAEKEKARIAIHQAQVRLALYGDDPAVLAIADFIRKDPRIKRCREQDKPDIAMYEKIREGVVHEPLSDELRSAMGVVILWCDTSAKR